MSEYAADREFVNDDLECTVVSEMASGAGVLLPLSKEQIEEVTEGDDDPKFATFLIESGWSKQGNYWGQDVFQSVQEQINEASEPIVGYLGHIPPELDGYAFPDIQLQWLKSKLEVSQDKVKLLAKAYVLPGTKGRDYLKRRLTRSVSWRGSALKKPIKGGSAMSDFKLESIDLSRPRKAGMNAVMVGGLTSEMDEGRNDVKPEEIKALQQNELRAHNPELVSEIETTATKPLTEKLEKQTEELEAANENVNLIAEIRKLFSIEDDGDVLAVLGKTVDELKKAGRTAKDAILDSVLEKKFKGDENKSNRVLIKRLLASEMDNVELAGDETKDRDAVEGIVNEMVNSDDEIRELVGEMKDTHEEKDEGRTTQSDNGRRQPREIKDGYESSTIRVRAARR